MARVVIRRKADGQFYRRTEFYRGDAWTEAVAKARIFTHAGHARNCALAIALTPHWMETRDVPERHRLRRERFNALYDVVPVAITVSET